MSSVSDLRIAVLPGDGIGVEVMDACLPVVESIARQLNCPPLSWNRLPGGAGCLSRHRHRIHRRGDARSRARGRHPVRRHGAARRALSRRHRDRAAARHPHGARFVCGRAADPRASRHCRAALATRVPQRSTSSSCANRPKGCTGHAAAAACSTPTPPSTPCALRGTAASGCSTMHSGSRRAAVRAAGRAR